MKILHLNLTDLHHTGGTGIAMHRLHQSLQTTNLSSSILCNAQTLAPSPQVQTIHRSLPIKGLEKLLRTANRSLGLDNLHSLTSFSLPTYPLYQQADLLHLHCIHQGYFNYLALPSLTRRKPTVFTLHDMWAFTGGCHYSNGCDRWQIGCGHCPTPTARQHMPRDASDWEWQLKRWVYQRSNLVIATPSQWMANQVHHSFLNRFPVHCIPNGIDTSIYQPLNTELCRALLGIPLHKTVLMTVAYDLDDPRKGSDLLLQALQTLPQPLRSNVVLLVMGKGGEAIARQLSIPVINLGLVNDDEQKAIAYAAADLFLFPTRADNGPLVILESLACGTPIVSFRVGGVPEFVESGRTGYLAAPENVQDFQHGIIRLLDNPQWLKSMRSHCRTASEQQFSLALHTQRYIDLYQHLLTCPTPQPTLAYAQLHPIRSS